MFYDYYDASMKWKAGEFRASGKDFVVSILWDVVSYGSLASNGEVAKPSSRLTRKVREQTSALGTELQT